jgi:hypothetical protein
LDRLVAEGQVSPGLYDEVLIHAQRTQSTAEEAILQLGLMSEADLLKYIAGVYRGSPRSRFSMTTGAGRCRSSPRT